MDCGCRTGWPDGVARTDGEEVDGEEEEEDEEDEPRFSWEDWIAWAMATGIIPGFVPGLGVESGATCG